MSPQAYSRKSTYVHWPPKGTNLIYIGLIITPVVIFKNKRIRGGNDLNYTIIPKDLVSKYICSDTGLPS